MKLRLLMAAIALLAIALGVGIALHRRSARFTELALAYEREADRLQGEFLDPPGPFESSTVQAIGERMHQKAYVADEYRRAASRPWVLADPDPNKIVCLCGYH